MLPMRLLDPFGLPLILAQQCVVQYIVYCATTLHTLGPVIKGSAQLEIGHCCCLILLILALLWPPTQCHCITLLAVSVKEQKAI